MRKLSETFALTANQVDKQPIAAPSIDDRTSKAWQSLVLFDGVLDPDKALHLSEIEKLASYLYGRAIISIAHTDYAKDLEDWTREESYKGLTEVNSTTTMVYPFKTKFEDLVQDDHNGEYTAPLNAVLFQSDGVENYFIALCCGWGDGLFRNDFYPVGLLADTEDLEGLIDEKIRR